MMVQYYRSWEYMTHGFGVIKMNTNGVFTVHVTEKCQTRVSLTTTGVSQHGSGVPRCTIHLVTTRSPRQLNFSFHLMIIVCFLSISCTLLVFSFLFILFHSLFWIPGNSLFHFCCFSSPIHTFFRHELKSICYIAFLS